MLRNAAALASILGQNIHIYNIRRRREAPGLKDEHLQGLMLLRDITSGEIVGGEIGSYDIVLRPGNGSDRDQFTSVCCGLGFL